MPKQPALSGLHNATKKKQTRHALFLAEMDKVMPWGRLLEHIEPHYPKPGPNGGRPPMPLEMMLRVYFQTTGCSIIPDETTIIIFRHLLARHGLIEAIFAGVNVHLAEKGIGLRSGTQVDATIIDASSSSKNKSGVGDPAISSTKKRNDWYFGMKAHLGVDADSGVTHSLETSTAKLLDSQVWDELLHGGEDSVWADKGYVSAKREAVFKGPGKVWGVMRKALKGGKLHPLDVRNNLIIAKVRAEVQHPFRIIKRQFGYMKTRYRGLATNRAQLFTLFALGNLFLLRRKLNA